MLTYAGVCWRMLAYAGVCWRMQVDRGGGDLFSRMLTYADVCWRMQVDRGGGDLFKFHGKVEMVRWDRTRNCPPYDDLFRVK